MARFSRIQVAQKMKETGLVPLFYHNDFDESVEVLNAIYKSGARILEFTNRGDYAHEVFKTLNQYAEKNLPELIMGVGSVTSAAEASLYMQLGANFVVTPVLRKDIAIVCNRRKVLWSAGCGSLKEITDAEELGCEIVKLFPAGIYGPAFIKGIRGPQKWTDIMPTGGVSPDFENLSSWITAGACCVGMGSKLIVKNEQGKFDLKRIKELTLKSLSDINKIRSSL